MSPDPEFLLWWETDNDSGDGLWHLVALVPPGFPRDIETTGDLAESLRLTAERCGGFTAVYTKMRDPALPWYTHMSPNQHATLWSLLLRQYAKSPVW